MNVYGGGEKVVPPPRPLQGADGRLGPSTFTGSSSGLPNRLTLPRRYEDTKPVQMQNITHRNILGIGQNVNASIAEKYELEKQSALKEVERAVWKEAEILKVIAVNNALEKLSNEHKKELFDREKTYERALKEESLRASLTLQRQATEQLAEQQEMARRNLQEALVELRQRADAERIRSVNEVRLEEQRQSADAVLKIDRDAAEALRREVERLAADKIKAMKELNETQLTIAKSAEQHHLTTMEALQKRLAELQLEMEAQEEELGEEIRRRERSQAEVQARIVVERLKEASVVRELQATQLDWQAFLRRSGIAIDLAGDDAVSIPRTGETSEIRAYQICADQR